LFFNNSGMSLVKSFFSIIFLMCIASSCQETKKVSDKKLEIPTYNYQEFKQSMPSESGWC